MNFKALIVLILTVALILSSVAFTFGQENEVTIRDLGIEHTGLLPSNPFYFTKEWKRGIRSLFSFSPIKKIDADLSVANEKIAELKQLANHDLDTAERKAAILNDYREIIHRLTARIPSLAVENETAHTTLQNVLEKSTLHSKLLEELNISSLSADLNTLTKETITSLYRDTVTRTILSFELLHQGAVKDALALSFESEFVAGVITEQDIANTITALPEKKTAIIQALDEIRERITTDKLRTVLGKVRDTVLAENSDHTLLTGDVVTGVLQTTEDTVAELEKITRSDAGEYIYSLREKAQFNIDQARTSLNRGNFEIAFGHVSVARAAAQTALDELRRNTSDIEQTINALKQQYDTLNERIREEEQLSIFKDTLMAIEKEIVALSQYGSEKVKDFILPLRNAMLHLETLYIQLGQ